MKKMGIPEGKMDELYTYSDYREWPDEERWELIEGVPYDMSPAPSRFHQDLLMIVSSNIFTFLKGKKCKVYAAPFDVLFPDDPAQEEEEIQNVVQPDISVICDRNKLTEKGCTGAPDLIVEILSPSTGKKDMDQKFHLYERHGVREYWIVDPGNRFVQIFSLREDGTYDTGELFVAGSSLNSRVLKDLTLSWEELFLTD
ncbi:MAG: Uma2 family endonuclease [Spirochaetales bacterium]|nr:Uma2 family endonuclease [Spirochaetales bacterium]